MSVYMQLYNYYFLKETLYELFYVADEFRLINRL